MADVGQNVIQPPVVKDVVHTDEEESIKDGNESANTSVVYSPMLVDHEKSLQNSSFSLTAERLSSSIDIYTSEFYSYLRDVEVVNNYLI